MDYVKQYMELIKSKAEKWKKTRPEGNTPDLYLEGLKDEVQEIYDEIRENNHVYLEDELGDIIWDYLNILFYLQEEGKITSWEEVFRRSFEKYSERVAGQINGVLWKDVKSKQKEKLQKEHQSHYGKDL